MSSPTHSPPDSLSAGGAGAGTWADVEAHRLHARVMNRLFGEPAAPTTIGRFRVERRLGAGAMGVVYAAVDAQLGRRVAIKLLHPHLQGDEQGRARLLREARAMARLEHEHVARIYEVGAWGEQVYIAMELIEGVTLEVWLRERPRPWQVVLAVYLQAGRALAAAHHAGLLHRDFKPENVLVDVRGRARVLDFGLTRALDAGESLDDDLAPLTRTGSILGTPAYMAPEQQRHGTAEPRSDQFSFCVALFEGLFGLRPFGAVPRLGPIEIAPIPRDSRVPPRIRRAIARGLAEKPEDRWPTMDDLLAALQPAGRFESTRARSLALAGGAAAAAAGLVALGVKLAQHDARAPESGQVEATVATSVAPGLTDPHAGELAAQRAAAERQARALRVRDAAFSLLPRDPTTAALLLRELDDPGALALRVLAEPLGAAILRGHDGPVLAVRWVDAPDVPEDRREEAGPEDRRIASEAVGPGGRAGEGAEAGPEDRREEAGPEDRRKQGAEAGPEDRRRVGAEAGPEDRRRADAEAGPEDRRRADAEAGPEDRRGPGGREASGPSIGPATGDAGSRAVSRDSRMIETVDAAGGVRRFTSAGARVGSPTRDGSTERARGPGGEALRVDARGQVSFETGDRATALRGVSGPLSAVAWSGARAAAAGPRGEVWVAAGSRVTMVTGRGAAVGALAWDDAGRLLAIGRDDGGVEVWRVDGRPRRVAAVVGEGGVTGLALGTGWIASGSDDGSARVWRLGAGARPFVLRGHVGPVRALAFEPGGVRLVTGGDDGSARVWRLTPAALSEHALGAAVHAVAWSPDGALLAAAGERNVWLVPAAGGPVRRRDHDGSALALAWSPDGQQLAVADDAGVVTWLPRGEGAARREAVDRRGLLALAWDPRGDRLAAGGSDGSFTIWPSGHGLKDIGSPTRVAQNRGSIAALAWSPVDARLAAVTAAGFVLVRVEQTVFIELGYPLRALAWRPDGDAFAVAGEGRALVRVATATGARSELGRAGAPLWSVAWDPQDRWVVAGAADGALHYWSLHGDAGPEVLVGHGAGVRAVAFDPRGERLASAGLDGRVVVWPRLDADLHAGLVDATRACLTAAERRRHLDEPQEVADAQAAACERSLDDSPDRSP